MTSEHDVSNAASVRSLFRSNVVRFYAVAILICCAATAANGLPTGRDWTETVKTTIPGHTRLIPSGMAVSSAGVPLVYADVVGGIGQDGAALAWSDTCWVPQWTLGQGSGWLRDMRCRSLPQRVVWATISGVYEPGYPYSCVFLVTTADLGTTFELPDTIAYVTSGTWVFAGAASQVRQWVANSEMVRGLRLFTASARGRWSERRLRPSSEVRIQYGVAVAPISETTALVVWTNWGWDPASSGIRWGIATDSTWQEYPPPFDLGPLPDDVRLRAMGDGAGYFAAFAVERSHVVQSTFRQGEWGRPDSIRCAYVSPEPHYSWTVRMSPDSSAYPAIAWIANDARGVARISVACPTDSGSYPLGEELSGTEGVGTVEVARDPNGDVWVCWGNQDITGMYWRHSYVRATTRDLRAEKSGPDVAISWSLSEPAPGSHWVVLRTVGGGPFSPIARVRAAGGLAMAYRDSEIRPNQRKSALYQVRRECLDRTREWTSEPVAVTSHDKTPGLTVLPRALDGRDLRLSLSGFTSEVEVAVYDVQGRLVSRKLTAPAIRGSLALSLDPHLPGGVYFLRARDSLGEEAGAKIVVLR
jgi:hypothetical protein